MDVVGGFFVQRQDLAETIQPVLEAQHRVLPEHARAGMAHDGLHLFAPVAFITMHRTIDAGGLFSPEPAAVQPQGGIIQKALAFQAENSGGVVVVMAIAADHRGHRFPFPCQAPAGGWIPGQWESGVIPAPGGNRPMGRARHSVRAGIVVRTGGGQRPARPAEICSGWHREMGSVTFCRVAPA